MIIDWQKMDGLLPAVVQHAGTGQVLMVGYMNEEALGETARTGEVTFFSRSRGKLWRKGETSGNVLKLVDIEVDCDGDALLVRAWPQGPTCHRETPSCFGEGLAPGVGFLAHLEKIIEARREAPPETSYTARLFREGMDRVIQKVGEEGVEVVIAAKNEDKDKLRGEAADLIFHLLVLLRARDMSLNDVVEELRRRHR